MRAVAGKHAAICSITVPFCYHLVQNPREKSEQAEVERMSKVLEKERVMRVRMRMNLIYLKYLGLKIQNAF